MPSVRACRLLSAAAAVLVFATPALAQTVNTIRIGAVVDQTGGSTSPHYRAAIELAGRQMNDALAQAGSNVRFDLVFGDSKSNPPFAQQEALRLINQHGVKALVGEFERRHRRAQPAQLRSCEPGQGQGGDHLLPMLVELHQRSRR